MKPDLSDCLTVVGLLLIAAGAWMVYRPLGLLLPGALLFAAGVRMGRTGGVRAQE